MLGILAAFLTDVQKDREVETCVMPCKRLEGLSVCMIFNPRIT